MPPLTSTIEGKENKDDQEYAGYLAKVKTLNQMKLSLKDILTQGSATPRQKQELVAQIQGLEREIDTYEQGIFN